MKALVIGSKGFIGSFMVKNLQNHGIEVFESDLVPDHGNPHYLQSVDYELDHAQLFSWQEFDVCINCSGGASVSDSIRNPTRDFWLNVVNTFGFLDSIRRYQPDCKYVNLSSAAVYGNATSIPIGEDTTLAPISPYGFHKRSSEEICDEFHSQWNLNVVSVRLFSAYGQGLRKQLLWDILQKSRQNSTIELFGTGQESRDFLHVTDVAESIRLIVDNCDFRSNRINVGSGQETTIQVVASRLCEALGYKGRIVFNGEERSGDPQRWQADISQLQAFGFHQKMSLNDGLEKYAQWALDSN